MQEEAGQLQEQAGQPQEQAGQLQQEVDQLLWIMLLPWLLLRLLVLQVLRSPRPPPLLWSLQLLFA
jgi:hypothetical protein